MQARSDTQPDHAHVHGRTASLGSNAASCRSDAHVGPAKRQSSGVDSASNRQSTLPIEQSPCAPSLQQFIESQSRGGVIRKVGFDGIDTPEAKNPAFVPAANEPQGNTKGKSAISNATLPLSCVAVALGTLLILLTTATVLTVSVVYSLKAANNFAFSYSQANIVAASQKVSDFVAVPLSAYSELKLAANFGYLPNVVTGTDYIDTSNETNASAVTLVNEAREAMFVDGWHSRMQAMLFASNLNLIYVGAGLADASWVSCVVLDLPTRAHECEFINPRNVTHQLLNAANSLPSTLHYRQAERYANESSRDDPFIVDSGMDYNPLERPWYIEAPKLRGSDPVFSTVYVDFSLGIPIVDLNGPLYASDGTFLGVTSLSLDLRQISSFLAQLPFTTHSITTLVDSEGYLLGASDRRSLTFTYAPGSAPSPPPQGCEEYTDSTSEEVSVVCRHTPSTYGNARLRALQSNHPWVFARGGNNNNDANKNEASFTKVIELEGEACVVSKAPIAARTSLVDAKIDWRMYTVMPVSDVTGQIVAGRNVAIIIASLMVTVSCAVCGVAMLTLLRPLSVLADLIEGASELKDDMLGAEVAKSSFREIRAIQDAFVRLGQQLQRAKSFLPASLLAQLESGLEEDSDANDTDEEGFAEADRLNVSKQDDEGTEASSTFTSQHADSESVTNTETELDSSTIARARRPRGQGLDTSSYRTGKPSAAARNEVRRVISSNVSLIGREKAVTVGVLNLRHFHRTVASASALPTSQLEAYYAELVDGFQGIAKECKGILDSFHGDRFYFTFNAVRPCNSHATMGATAMVRIVSSLSHRRSSSSLAGGGAAIDHKVTCGVATGRCMVGNLGSEKAKRFTVVGPAFSYAAVLERLCKRYPETSILLAIETARECETAVVSLLVDFIAVPERVPCTHTLISEGGVHIRAAPVAAAMHLRSGVSSSAQGVFVGPDLQGEEWMYELAGTNMKCDFRSGNSAFRAALSGNIADARGHLSAFVDDKPVSTWTRNRIESLIDAALTSSSDTNSLSQEAVAPLGYYYDVCVSNARASKIDIAKICTQK